MKRNLKILTCTTALFLALPASALLGSVDVMKAQAAEWQSPGPGSPNSASPTETREEQAPAVPEKIPTHTHNFLEVTLQEATETEDEIIQFQCSCGEVNGQFTVPGSAAGLFIKNTIRKIINAPKDSIVTIETKIWTCYTKAVMEALSLRPDVTLVTNYRYKHVDYTVTIPAGYDTNTLTDENGYCGFRYLDQVFSGSELTKDN